MVRGKRGNIALYWEKLGKRLQDFWCLIKVGLVGCGRFGTRLVVLTTLPSTYTIMDREFCLILFAPSSSIEYFKVGSGNILHQFGILHNQECLPKAKQLAPRPRPRAETSGWERLKQGRFSSARPPGNSNIEIGLAKQPCVERLPRIQWVKQCKVESSKELNPS